MSRLESDRRHALVRALDAIFKSWGATDTFCGYHPRSVGTGEQDNWEIDHEAIGGGPFHWPAWDVPFNGQRFILFVEIAKNKKTKTRRWSIMGKRIDPPSSAGPNTNRITWHGSLADNGFLWKPQKWGDHPEIGNRLHSLNYRCTKSGVMLPRADDPCLLPLLLIALSVTEDEKSKSKHKPHTSFDLDGLCSAHRHQPLHNIFERRDDIVFGLGGEGADHRRLKEWIAANPERIGLGPAPIATDGIEHAFITGNHVDVLVKYENGVDAVVEVETYSPLPGAHQALMYRALRLAERDEPLDSTTVVPVLVAHAIDETTAGFCRRHHIVAVQIPPEEIDGSEQ